MEMKEEEEDKDINAKATKTTDYREKQKTWKIR